MTKREPRALILLLTRTCCRALESAAVMAVKRRHREVTTAHFFRAALADSGSDVAQMLEAHRLDVGSGRTGLHAGPPTSRWSPVSRCSRRRI